MNKDKIIKYVYGFLIITIYIVASGYAPYGYYQFLRWAVSVSLLFLLFNAHNQSDDLTEAEKKENVIAKYFFGISIIFFNPIFPIHLNLVIWSIIDGVVVLGLGFSLFVLLNREQEMKRQKSMKVHQLLLDDILSSIENGNKSGKVDGLTKLSKFLESDEHKDIRSINLGHIDKLTGNLNLEGADLSNSRFNYLDLSNSNLKNANLENSIFVQTRFRGADLENANLRNSKLTFAKVGGANLKNADLEGAYLCGAGFKNTNLLGANLRGANLQYADISDSLIKLSDSDSPPNFKNATYNCRTKFPNDFNPEKEGMIEVDMYTHKKI